MEKFTIKRKMKKKRKKVDEKEKKIENIITDWMDGSHERTK